MANQVLTKWVKKVYPYLKEGCGLPSWVLPEHSLNRSLYEIGDTGLLNVGKPLSGTDSVKWLFETEPDPASVSPTEWWDAIKQHQSFNNLSPVVTAFIEVADVVIAQFPRLRSRIDPMIICRTLAVLLYAPLVEQGKAVLAEIASVLSEHADQPAQLILSCAEAVVRSDISTLERVNQCIMRYPEWQEWTSALQDEVLKCRYKPKLIAVTPPLSSELTGILATMIKEGADYDKSGRDNQGSPSNPVSAH